LLNCGLFRYGWIVGGVFFLLWASLRGDDNGMTFEDIMEVEGLQGLTQFIYSARVLAVAVVIAVAIAALGNYMRNLYSQNNHISKAKKRRSIIVRLYPFMLWRSSTSITLDI
jgi:hypothetical protein